MSTEQSTQPKQNLTQQYQDLMLKLQELDAIPAYRPDVKAKQLQELTGEALALTGMAVTSIDVLAGQVAVHEQLLNERLAKTETTH